MRAYARNLGYRAFMTQTSRLRVFGVVVALALLLTGLFAAAAEASSVSGVTVANTSPSSAAGAQTVYTIGFTTSSTGALASGNTISIAFPTGTDLSQIFSATIRDTSTGGNTVGTSCSHSAAGTPPVETCSISSGSVVHNLDQIIIALDDVVNTTTAANQQLTVTTTADATGGASAVGTFSVVAANAVSQVTASNTSVTTAAGAQTVYTVRFKASGTGGLSGAAGSTIAITFPAGTDLSHIFAGQIKDDSTNAVVGTSCFRSAANVSPPVETCSLSSTAVTNPNDMFTITLQDVVNTTTPGTPSMSVSTSSDVATPAGATTVSVVAASPVSQVSADNTSVTTAAGAQTVYTVRFKASGTGGLSGAAGSTIAITFPAGTDLSHIFAGQIKDDSTNAVVGTSCFRSAANVSPPVETCSLSSTAVTNPNDMFTITLQDVVNTTTPGTPSMSVSTSSDVATPAGATTVSVVAASPVSQVSADNTSVTTAAGAQTVYTVRFKASGTGGLSGAAGSTIAITSPAGTDLSHIFAGQIKDDSTNAVVGTSCFRSAANVSPPVETCSLSSTAVTNPNDMFTITLQDVVNTTTPGTPSMSVSTSSDVATPAGATTVSVVAANPVSQVNVTLSNQAPSAAGVVYTVGFKASGTGGLSGAAGSTIAITFPAGTDLSHIFAGQIKDDSTNAVVGTSCFRSAANVSPPVETCSLSSTAVTNPNDMFTITLQGITNPPTAASETAAVATSSDVATPPGSGNYNVGGNPPPPTITSISPSSGPAAGGTSVTINGSNFTGSTVTFGSAAASITSNTGNQMVVTSPAGTGTVDVIVTNAGGTSVSSAADRFTYVSPPPPPPPTSPPAVAPSSPSTPSATSAAVSGAVNPHGLATTVVFQYGLDLSQRGPGSSTTLYDQSTAPQQVGSGTGNQSVSASLTNLIAGGLYHVRMVATNSAGTTNGPDQTFTTPKAAPPPPPVLGKTQNAAPVSGKTFILINGKFVPLTSATKIPSGATIDALHGTLSLTSATGAGKKTQTGTFGGAVFKVTQARSGLTTLSLVNNAFKGAPSFAACTTKKGKAVTAALSKKVLQLLHAKDNHGKFRSKGRYAAATTRGTVWSIADRCDGTLTSVSSGVVTVNDFVRHVNVTVRAHHSYLALAKPTKHG